MPTSPGAIFSYKTPLGATPSPRPSHKNGQSPNPSPAFSASRPWLCLPSRTSFFTVCPKTSQPVFQVQPKAAALLGQVFTRPPRGIPFSSFVPCSPSLPLSGPTRLYYSAARRCLLRTHRALGPRPCLPMPLNAATGQQKNRSGSASWEGVGFGVRKTGSNLALPLITVTWGKLLKLSEP